MNKKALSGSPVSLHFTFQPVSITFILFCNVFPKSRFTPNLCRTTSFVIVYLLFYKYLDHVSWFSVIRNRLVWISAKSLAILTGGFCDFSRSVQVNAANVSQVGSERFILNRLKFRFSCGAAVQRGRWPPHSWCLHITYNDASQSVKTPLDKQSARHRLLSTWLHTTLTADKHPCPRWDSY